MATKEGGELWDDPRITAFGMLLEAHAAVMADVGRELEQAAGVPVQWFEVLLRLARSPEHRLRMTELAAQVRLSTSGLTRLIDRIEEAGHVARESCPSDRRGAFAVLTPEGEQVLRAALPAHLDTIDQRVASPLGDQLMAATDLLRVLRDGRSVSS